MESGYVFFRDNACYNANTANERRIRIGWLFVTHMSIVRTYVRVDDKRGRGGTERGEGDRTVRKLRAYWSQPGETRVSLVFVASYVCVRAVARLCAAGTRKLVRQALPTLPPIFFHRVQVSVSPWRVGISLSPMLCQRTRATLVSACTCIHARSWIVFSLASECNRVGVGEPLARVPVLVLCRSRGRILSRVVPAHTIFACALDENYCVCVCVREGGEGRRRVDAVFFFFWVDL